MGQTQILFIVLSVIIVGIAVAVGITQFGESATEANKNALLLDCQSIISSAQIWFRKPTTMGGGGGHFTGIDSLEQIGVASQNENTDDVGFQYVAGDQTFEVSAHGRERGVFVRMVYDHNTGQITTTFE